MAVTENIKALMDARGLSALEVARRARINPTGVYDILSGKTRSPRVDTLGKIAQALGVSVVMLFEDRPNEQLRSELSALFAQLPDDERKRLIVTAKAWLQSQSEA